MVPHVVKPSLQQLVVLLSLGSKKAVYAELVVSWNIANSSVQGFLPLMPLKDLARSLFSIRV